MQVCDYHRIDPWCTHFWDNEILFAFFWILLFNSISKFVTISINTFWAYGIYFWPLCLTVTSVFLWQSAGSWIKKNDCHAQTTPLTHKGTNLEFLLISILNPLRTKFVVRSRNTEIVCYLRITDNGCHNADLFILSFHRIFVALHSRFSETKFSI